MLIHNLYPCEISTEKLYLQVFVSDSITSSHDHELLFPHCSRAQYWPKFWPMFCSFPGTWTGTEMPGEIKPTTHRATNAALISSVQASYLCVIDMIGLQAILPKQLHV